MCLERGNGIHEGLVSGGTILWTCSTRKSFRWCNEFWILSRTRVWSWTKHRLGAEFCTDCGHSEVKFNHQRCLRFFGQWESPDRASDIISHLPSIWPSFWYFRRLPQNCRLLRWWSSSIDEFVWTIEICRVNSCDFTFITGWMSSEFEINGKSESQENVIESEMCRIDWNIPSFLNSGNIFLKLFSIIVQNLLGTDRSPAIQSSEKSRLSESNWIARIVVGITLVMWYLHSLKIPSVFRSITSKSDRHILKICLLSSSSHPPSLNIEWRLDLFLNFSLSRHVVANFLLVISTGELSHNLPQYSMTILSLPYFYRSPQNLTVIFSKFVYFHPPLIHPPSILNDNSLSFSICLYHFPLWQISFS
jgi:hypothetical protein